MGNAPHPPRTDGDPTMKVTNHPHGVTGISREFVNRHTTARELVWLENVPGELRESFAPYAHWLLRYAPGWLSRLAVEYDAELDADTTLSMICDRQQNAATVKIGPGWLSQDTSGRNTDTVHELVHIYTAAVVAFVESMEAREWEYDETLRGLRLQQYTMADESSTVDLSYLLAQFLPLPVSV